MNLFIDIFSGLLSGIFGFAGGRGEDWAKERGLPPWMFKSWVRDWMIAPLCALVAWLFGVHSWWLIVMIPITGGAISTYWDFLFPEEQNRDNFWLHGFFIGLAAFPICLVTGHWWMLAIRCIILAIWMGVVHLLIHNADWEEFTRYTLVPSTLWMIC